MGVGNLLDPRGNVLDLCRCIPHELNWITDCCSQSPDIHGNPFISGKTINQIVFVCPGFPHRQCSGDRMFFDRFVGRFAPNARFDSRNQNFGSGQKRKVPTQLSINHGRIGTEVGQDGEQGFELAIDRKE